MRRMLNVNTAKKKNERGFSILEAMIASVIMIIGIGGLMALFAIAAARNSGQGNQATRCTEYAQDKMEQLMALQYTTTSTDTTSQVVGSTSIPVGGTCYSSGAGLADGGSLTSPAANYVDYVNPSPPPSAPTSATGCPTDPLIANGILIPNGISSSPSGALYKREWSIVTDSTTHVKTITVYVTALFTAAVSQNLAPNTTLIAMKQQY
jgi:type II secretory pathway pseudopilin PulG